MERPLRPASDLIVLHPRDDIGVALQSFPAGTTITGPAGPLALVDEVPYGHKVSTRSIALGEPGAEVRPDHRLRGRRHPGRLARPRPQPLGRRLRARLRHRPDPTRPTPRSRRTADLRGLRPRRRPGRARATTSPSSAPSTARRARASTSPSESAAGLLERLPERRRRRRDHAQGRLRRCSTTARTTPARPHARRVRQHPNVGGYILVGLGCETARRSTSSRSDGH